MELSQEIDIWKVHFVDNIGDILVVYDHEYKHVYANKATVKESGLTLKQMIGKSNRELGIPADVSEVTARENQIDTVFKSGLSTEYTTYHTFPSGKTEHYHTKFSPEIVDGKVQFVFAITRNITQEVLEELKTQKLLKQLRQKNKKLDETNQTLDNFVHVVAHDLKNPLNNIQQLLSLFESESAEEIKMRYFNGLKLSVNRLENIILSLVDVVSAQSAGHSLAKQLLFQDLIDAAVEDLHKEVKESEVEIKVSLDAPFITYIEGYLISIVKNLISNAIKYRNLRLPLLLEIRTEKRGKYILLEIKDNGIGIDLNLYGEKLFLPFRRFTEQAEGKGIGLSIIKTMIEKNGGRIEVDSKVNEGTSFKVFLKEY